MERAWPRASRRLTHCRRTARSAQKCGRNPALRARGPLVRRPARSRVRRPVPGGRGRSSAIGFFASRPDRSLRQGAGRAVIPPGPAVARAPPGSGAAGGLRLGLGFTDRFDGLGPRHAAEFKTFFADPSHQSAGRAEMEVWEETAAQARATRLPGDLPLVVISADETDPLSPAGRVRIELQEELASLYSRGSHRILAGTTHGSLATNRAPAAQWPTSSTSWSKSSARKERMVRAKAMGVSEFERRESFCASVGNILPCVSS